MSVEPREGAAAACLGVTAWGRCQSSPSSFGARSGLWSEGWMWVDPAQEIACRSLAIHLEQVSALIS